MFFPFKMTEEHFLFIAAVHKSFIKYLSKKIKEKID